MRAYQEPARPARLLAALAVGAVVVALATRRRGAVGRSTAATVAGRGRPLTAWGRRPGDRPQDVAEPTHPPRRPGRGPDELRLWVEAGGVPAPIRPGQTTDPLSG